MKGYDKNYFEKVLKVLAVSVTIDVLIKHFGVEKLSDDKKLSKMEEDILSLKNWCSVSWLGKKWSFSLRISSENVIKSVVSCAFGHIYWINP